MNRFVTYFALLATLLPLIACGESSDYGANANQQKETTLKSKNCVTNADCFEETWDFYQNPGNVTSISQGEADYCEKYGRLYIWGNAKSACPSGWHLPSNAEWETLFSAVGGSSTAGKQLKSMSGWNKNGNGTDAFGFLAFSAGFKGSDGNFGGEGAYSFFWSSTEYDSQDAYSMYLYYEWDGSDLSRYNKRYKYSVRCIKD